MASPWINWAREKVAIPAGNCWFGFNVHLFSGAEAPAFRHGVSAVSSLEWPTGGVLRHAACEQSARCDSPWKTEPGGLLAGKVTNAKTLASKHRATPTRAPPPPVV